ncbi:hypothetical protein ABB37_06632 [Leptomonas pyrrhocoris]|uniref:Right handed beta helix domain-containing protein n=1 Tax=Leptomonas pyrrhocoris TaxID=157538 RepID=A0A0N0DTQ5_LEPPY|nr:hypothetical protein ABB37_06632 [Leptomonas pyrrhocoris]XP_015656254.1 hypothetical protein ABB37_06632 [Leptomonas pyrrhocoris]KPA77814.1 hypothetical protein ABB37_06632 [Leptomonas pyrrhocoris]KPA77815.1 hypothetical protein ABB37_06632 [Leptomonas pyrrhocoris]|eukprot:XP_015656253.1 hypothetical protein ABB37_06632 [Leptomonas pyrrhocoris]
MDNVVQLAVPTAHRGTAPRWHRTLALHAAKDAHVGRVHCTPRRTLFRGWKAVDVRTEDAASAADTRTDAVSHAQAGEMRDGAAAATRNEITQLRQQIVDLKEALEASQETVKQLLVLTSAQKASGDVAAAAASAAAAVPCGTPGRPCGPCGYPAEAAKSARGACYVVRTSEELVDALRGRGSEHASRTILLDGKLFLLDMYGKVEVDQARVSVVGNNATVIGHISVRGRGAVLAASDVFFLCPYDIQLRLSGASSGGGTTTTVNATGRKEGENYANLTPVIGATAGAGVHLDRCVLSNGRDGVYLGMGSHCTLKRVRIVNCIRGLYEGVGCRTSMVDACAFQSNRYDMVLLGPGGAERARRLFQKISPSNAYGENFTASFSPDAAVADVLAPDVTAASAIALQQNKAQVVLQHNPITDIYEDCWVDGQQVQLSEVDATAGLSDPVF